MEKKEQHLKGGELVMYDSTLAMKITKTGTEILEKSITEMKKMEEIEKIAWQEFQNILGISFKRELTLEEKKQITDQPEFDYYRELATKIYEKKQKALLNKKYPIIDIPADGKSGMMGGAYCLCFVYSKYKGNVVLRGYMREVENYLKENYTHYFCNFSLWYRGRNRDIWKFWKKDISIYEPMRTSKYFKRGKWKVKKYDSDSIKSGEYSVEKEFKFKRLPKRWIPEFDKL